MAAILFPIVVVVLVFVALGIWAALDDTHRTAQAIALLMVLLLAFAALLVSAWRTRRR